MDKYYIEKEQQQEKEKQITNEYVKTCSISLIMQGI